ncbi:MAG: hypothetical protein K0M70_13785 [Arenimonas sp.]|uniref:hypothetical protein n=1 Tax=Arenimonas sp. TaxID=1872635 RepID=UPI0025BBB621|nr:hypothetical protein [Arenimonas sp.]MBW8368915.1 hypothetical protein [Arenimonas sp.]
MLVKVFETPGDGDYFAGYYDKSPLDGASARLLALKCSFINRMPVAGESVDIGYFDFAEGSEFKRLASTTAWNWQQGCMLQWLGPDFQSRILFNDLRGERYRAILLDVRSGEERVLPMAAYAVSSDGEFALCVDNERHYWFRPGYNYQGPPRPEKRVPLDPEDGIWRMSLQHGEVRRVISMTDLMDLGVVSSMDGAEHWVEHVMINPSNTRFAFLHRWRGEAGTASRLITADVDGGNLFVLNGSGRVSHCCWRDDVTMFGYCGRITTFNRLRSNKSIAKSLIKPLLPIYHRLFPSGGAVSRAVTGDCFQLMHDRSRRTTLIGREVIPEDGHPTYRPGSASVIVNDSYPDENGNCRLFLFDVDRREVMAEVTVASDPDVRATGFRCDLHPKWSFDGKFVAADTISKRGRAIAVYRIDSEKLP